MATVTDIKQGIAANLKAIPGLRVTDYVPDNVNPPQAVVEPSSIDYDTTMHRGLDTFNFRINVVVGRASDRIAQQNLDAYCSGSGDFSIKSAVESDRTLGGVVQDCRVSGLSSYGSVTIGDTIYLAAEFSVIVYAN